LRVEGKDFFAIMIEVDDCFTGVEKEAEREKRLRKERKEKSCFTKKKQKKKN